MFGAGDSRRESRGSVPRDIAEREQKENWKAALRDEQEAAIYLNSTQVRQRYGGISDMTLWRWLNDEALGFPTPIFINRRRFFNRAALEAFDARQAAKSVWGL